MNINKYEWTALHAFLKEMLLSHAGLNQFTVKLLT